MTACGRSDLDHPLPFTQEVHTSAAAVPRAPEPAGITPPTCAPEPFTAFTGCRSLFVVGVDASRQRYLTVSVDRSVVNFPTGTRFDAKATWPGVAIRLDTYPSPPAPNDELYCTDALSGFLPSSRTVATAGTVRVDTDNPEPNGPYRATVTVDDLTFDDGTSLCHVEFSNVLVGWWPG
ncbi:MAG: hypothetical protein JNG84_14110 [Archangium sp.]|nr:hypothetical protein [Archangium sp.]